MKISTFKQESHLDADLIDAVISQMGGKEAFKESAPDVSNHGIDGGFGNFIYYTDTVPFAQTNRSSILALLDDTAAEMGSSGSFELVSQFGCLNGDYSQSEIAEAIYGDSDDSTQVLNALAWFAGEEVCRSYTDLNC